MIVVWVITAKNWSIMRPSKSSKVDYATHKVGIKYMSIMTGHYFGLLAVVRPQLPAQQGFTVHGCTRTSPNLPSNILFFLR